MTARLNQFLLSISCLCLVYSPVYGQLSESRLVKDICTVENSLRNGIGQVTSDGKGIFFIAEHDSLGYQLWYSDGTKTGTQVLTDIVSTMDWYSPSPIDYIDSLLYFTSFDSSVGHYVWQTDGTQSGTQPVKDSFGSPLFLTSQSTYMKVFDNSIYYWASDPSKGWRYQLSRFDLITKQNLIIALDDSLASPRSWAVTDVGLISLTYNNKSYALTLFEKGSHNQTVLKISDGLIGIDNLLSIGNSLFFTARDENSTIGSLYRYDIIPKKLVKFTSISKSPSYITFGQKYEVFGDSLYFITEVNRRNEIWMASVNSDTLTRISDIGTDSHQEPRHLLVRGRDLYFTTLRSFPDGHINFWKVNLESLALDTIDVFSKDSVYAPGQSFSVIGSRLYFNGYRNDVGSELFYYDLVTHNTVLIDDFAQGSRGSYFQIITSVNDKIFTASNDAIVGNELGVLATSVRPKFTWLTLTLQIPGSSNPSRIAHTDGKLNFIADNVIDGYGLWEADVVTESAYQLKTGPRANYYSIPSHITNIEGVIYYQYYTNENRYVISRSWKNGELETIQLLAEHEYVQNMKGSEDVLFIETQNYVTDQYILYVLSNSSSQLIELTSSKYQFHLHESAIVHDKLFYSIQNVLYEVDLATLKVKRSSIVSGNVAVYRPIRSNGNKMYFTAYDNSIRFGTELWSSDGTKEGTKMMFDLTPGPASSYISTITPFGENVAFVRANDNGALEAWVYNPVVGEPEMIKVTNDIHIFSTDLDSDFLFITSPNIFDGKNLWCYNATTMNTELLHSLTEPQRYIGQYMSYLNGWCYYMNTSTSYQSILYQTDGTSQGTTAIKTWEIDDDISHPTNMIVANNKLFYSGYSKTVGRELFVADLPDYSVSERSKMKVVPNPVVGEVKLFVGGRTTGTKTDVDVFNITGQKVFQTNSIENPIHLNLEFLTPGIYIIRLSTGQSTKFVKY